MRANKYSKLHGSPVTSPALVDAPLLLYFNQANGRPQKIDLSFFNEGKYPRPDIAKACAEVFWLSMQGYAGETRTNFRNTLRVFNNFLNWREKDTSRQVTTTLAFSSSLLIEYQAYLSASSIEEQTKEATAASRYQLVTRFLELMKAHRPQYLPKELRIPSNPFLRQLNRSTENTIIGVSDLRLIAEAALKEVEEIKENNRKALDLLSQAIAIDEQARLLRKPRGFWKDLASALYYIVHVEGICSTSNNTVRLMSDHSHPTPQTAIGWYAPTSEEYFIPFLVLLYIRTAINVTSIFNLKRDCLVEHPLPLGLTICRFTKPRSGASSNKELSFPTRQPNGAIDLISFLLEYTQPWVKHAGKAERDSLFLYRCRTTGIRSAGRCFTQGSLTRFISRNNLPQFSFAQLRPSIATMLYLQTKDIFRVQRLLNHSSVRTTIKYVRGAIVHAQHNKEMSEGIDQMIAAVIGPEHHHSASVFTGSLEEVVAAKLESGEISSRAGDDILRGGCRTLISICKDPLDSPQPGEIKGRVCRSLHACIFCENIFKEDLPAVIKFRNDLEAEKAEMRSIMWEQLYGDTVREINKSILPCFPKAVIAEAELQVQQMQAHGIAG